MDIEISNNPSGFQAFELEGWELVSEKYNDHFSSLTSQSVAALLDAAEVNTGSRVLDVCTGPGVLAAGAVSRGADVVGVDFSAAAIAVAEKNVPNGRFQVGDAQNLPFANDSFDAVVCGFGIIHLPNPDKGLQEMCRVLRPGGKVAVSVWDTPSSENGFGILFETVKQFGDMKTDLPHGPDFLQFSTPEKMCEALLASGFREPAVTSVDQFWNCCNAGEFLQRFLEGSVRARALLLAQSADAREAIEQTIEATLEKFRDEAGTYVVPMPALVGSARL